MTGQNSGYQGETEGTTPRSDHDGSPVQVPGEREKTATGMGDSTSEWVRIKENAASAFPEPSGDMPMKIPSYPAGFPDLPGLPASGIFKTSVRALLRPNLTAMAPAAPDNTRSEPKQARSRRFGCTSAEGSRPMSYQAPPREAAPDKNRGIIPDPCTFSIACHPYQMKATSAQNLLIH